MKRKSSGLKCGEKKSRELHFMKNPNYPNLSLSRVCLFATLWTEACQVPLSMGFPRKEYQCGLTLPPAGGLPDPGVEPVSPVLQVDSLPT